MPAQDDLARSMAGAIRGPGRLMRLPGATHGSPIFFEHRLEHPYARRDDQLLQLGLGIDEDVNHRPVARRRGCRLATTRDCVRLLLQGGSFARRLSPRFSHRSYSTTSEGAAASNFNSYWDIPRFHGRYRQDREDSQREVRERGLAAPRRTGRQRLSGGPCHRPVQGGHLRLHRCGSGDPRALHPGVDPGH